MSFLCVYDKDPGLIINPEDSGLNLIVPRDWVLPDPDNEALTLARAVLLRHVDSSKTIPFCSGTGPHLTIIIIIIWKYH